MPDGSRGHSQGWHPGGFGDMEGRPSPLHLLGLHHTTPRDGAAAPGLSPAHPLEPQPPGDSDGRTHVPIPD